LDLEMCMGMGFPWESHGDVNKTQKWEWGWERMGIAHMGIPRECE